MACQEHVSVSDGGEAALVVVVRKQGKAEGSLSFSNCSPSVGILFGIVLLRVGIQS